MDDPVIRVTLTNGQIRDLPTFGYAPEEAMERFETRRDPYEGDWLATTASTIVARAHIVEVAEGAA